MRDMLPPSAADLERALAASMNIAALGDEAAKIQRIHRPDVIALPQLPWLAWAMDTMVWPRSSPERIRRAAAQNSLRMHRLQGTLAGYRLAAATAGAEILDAVTPPGKLYLSPALTTRERNAFLARLPQLRIYRTRTAGHRQTALLHHAWLGGACFPAATDAVRRYLPRAYLWRNGVETELIATEVRTGLVGEPTDTVTEVAQPGAAGPVSYCAGHPTFLVASDAGSRIYRMRLGIAYDDSRELLHQLAVGPGLQAVSVRPQNVPTTGTRITGVFVGRPLRGQFEDGTSWDRMSQRIYLYDAASTAMSRRAVSLHLNQGQLGLPPYHAALTVAARGRASKMATGRYVGGHLVSRSATTVSATLSALRQVARVSDRISIDLVISRPALAGANHLSGTRTAGDWTHKS